MADESSTRPSLADASLLAKIDALFECNVGQYISLPQLVVVGDQSSGKSSVLEGLTELPFPRDSTLCTRFATHITFRRSNEESITVTIMPAKDASDAHKAKLQEFKRKDVRSLEAETFLQIMKDVQEVMGIDEGRAFSEDVLKIDLRGPKHDHISIIDVPGLFQNVTQGVTTDADIQLVERMVVGYMKSARSLMLAVVQANTDVATQGILKRAREWDPKGLRTLGVITKPDLCDQGTEEDVVAIVAGNKEPRLRLGWHLVRNLGHSQLKDTSLNRNAIEAEFFRHKSPWNTVAPARVGVSALRLRLQSVLNAHVKREFQNVRDDVNERLKLATKQLDALGESRATVSEQRRYLMDKAIRFQETVTSALSANYVDSIFESKTSLRLVTAYKTRNVSFAKTMRLYGHKYHFEREITIESEDEDGPASRVPQDVQYVQDAEFMGGWTGSAKSSTLTSKRKGRRPHSHLNAAQLPDFSGFDTSEADSEFWANVSPTKAKATEQEVKVDIRDQASPTELDMLEDQSKIAVPRKNEVKDWLKTRYLETRGLELGTFQPSNLTSAFIGQSEKWDAIVLAYMSDVVSLVHCFIVDVLADVCTDPAVHENLKSILMPSLTKQYWAAMDHARFILRIERYEPLQTENHYFTQTKNNIKAKRFEALAKAAKDSDDPTTQLLQHMRLENEGDTVQEIHDIMQAYYKVALKRFVDNICMQAAGWYLLSGQHSPLKLFSPKFVNELSDESLSDIATEDESTKEARRELKIKIADLEKGKRLLV